MPIDLACLEAFLCGVARSPTARQLAPFVAMVEWAAENTELNEARARGGGVAGSFALLGVRNLLRAWPGALNRRPASVPPCMGCSGPFQPVLIPVPTLTALPPRGRYAYMSNAANIGGSAILRGSMYRSRSAHVIGWGHLCAPCQWQAQP
jgi:hypothetical protein